MSLPNDIFAALQAQETRHETTFIFETRHPFCPEIDGSVDIEELARDLLDGPTLTAVREALRDASCLLPLIGFRVVKVNGQYIDREDVETRARAAIKLLEGK